MKRILLSFVAILAVVNVFAQPDRWQQRISYQIDVNMNVQTNRFNGTEKIDYWNNSPDTLTRVFFHTYWNAFQPNSSMDVRSRELGKTQLGNDRRTGEPIYDWDSRVKDRISKLQPNEIGYQKVQFVKINGKTQQLVEHETILEVKLDKPILPRSKISMDVSFEAQVPLQIRRSGRDNAEGIRYSMSQWYPKVVEYDYQGWNANQYIAREFYGVWGDYHVNINIDKNYLVAASGTLENANQVGFGYETDGTKVTRPAGDNLKWSFDAKNVHDFVWAADPNYKLIKRQPKDGPLLYIVYKKVDSLETLWQRVADTVELAYPFIAKTFGKYPYKNYSFIQGGDGGMEYPMATLIKNASVGTALHEWMHSWYQMMMGTNESLYPWMDEGFTSYAESRVTAWMRDSKRFAQQASYRSYFDLVKSGREEPASTHSDHYNTNYAYSNAAYSKGAVFMTQLGYIVGDKTLDKIILEYYNQWRFKHPNPNDFIRVAEKLSGMELDWYKEYWINSTKTIDYGLGNIEENAGKAMITLKRVGLMPMPVDVLVTYKDGTKEMYNIPLNMMYGVKPKETEYSTIVLPEWRWTHPEYQFPLTRGVKDIKEIEIDPSMRLADVSRTNNKITVPE
jgi:hypothetical protein